MIAAPLRSLSIGTSSSEDKRLPYDITGKGYGKDGVKLFHVTRDGPYHSVHEFDIKVHIKLSGDKEYTEGENSDIVDSDALRNMMCVLGKKHGIEGPEKFALMIIKKTLEQYAHVVEVSMNVETYPWQRITQDNKQHNHAFIFAPTALRYCEVIMKRGDSKPTVISGFKGLRILKTTKSSFTKFIDDEYRTTPELYDRILSTIAEGAWEYTDIEKVDFTKDWETVRDAVTKTFAGDPVVGTTSTSTQRTAYLSVKQVLDELPQVAVMSLTLPNRHYNNFDMKPFQQLVPGENNDVFIPLDKPYGIVYAQLSRKDLKSN
ncbi:hypothetical protein KR044_005215 [Drosophila immigrans]|nr:hypothetical protein KR044_005215 [Drosophila immigrans]